MIPELNIERKIDLSNTADVQLLETAAEGNAELRGLIDEYLDDYLRLFPDQRNHEVYGAGSMTVWANGKAQIGSDILRILRLTKTIMKLRPYKGYDRLLKGLKNEFPSTFFEITVAGWCVERKVFRDIEFSPEVEVKGKKKYPEFLWQTDLGQLYGECKRLDVNGGKVPRLANRLFARIQTEYQNYGPWPDDLRLDFFLESGTTNNADKDFKRLILEAAATVKAGNYIGTTSSSNNISVSLCQRGSDRTSRGESMTVGTAAVGPVATRLSDAIFLSLTFSMAQAYRRAVVRLLKEARTQLPTDAKSAVFIDMLGSNTPRRTLGEILGHPAYENTPWVSLWRHDEMLSSTWRTDQPFDGSLIE
ncbi:MAG: hypothetical protein KA746_13880 [Pyrinomonadaceae bacterium]|nr:hypothetical protein [Pyrinomonadaceae bacterium]MBP6211782.1 hypothetical protein [Pyrinomonadaceae bacterium]